MDFYSYEQFYWFKLNDPFFAMFPDYCINRMIWLANFLASTPLINSTGKNISVLEYFLFVSEDDFWMAIEGCPASTSHILLHARHRQRERKLCQYANIFAQDQFLYIDELFEPSSKNQQKYLSNRKILISPRAIDFSPPISVRTSRTESIRE